MKSAALHVHREVEAGFREHVYRRCLRHELESRGHEVEEHRQLSVRFRDLVIHRAGEADLIVDDLVVVEVKARAALHPTMVSQVVGYLRATGLSAGLLLNFHAPRLIHDGCHEIVHPRHLVR